MTDQHEFAGKTIEEALELAARELGADGESIEYKLLETPKRFFFMGGSKEYRIRVLRYTPAGGGPAVTAPPPPVRESRPADAAAEDPEEDADSMDDQPLAEERHAGAGGPERREPPARTPETAGEGEKDELDRLMDLVEEFLDAWGMNLGMEVHATDELVEIDLYGDDEEYLLEKKGASLLSLQLILGKMLFKRGLIKRKLQVDCRGYRERREHELREIANRTADRVKQNGDDAFLNPLNPYERRIVHLALVDDDQVTTESMGEGYMKKIRVTRI